MARVWQEIGNEDGERLLLGWNCAAGGMGMTGRAYGSVPRGVERCGSVSWSSFVCGARLPDRSLPILDSLYGKQPRLTTGLFFRVRRSSACVLWAFIVWAAGRTWRGHGVGTVRGWRAFFGGMGPYGSGHLRGCCRFRPACCSPEGQFCALGARNGWPVAVLRHGCMTPDGGYAQAMWDGPFSTVFSCFTDLFDQHKT